VTSTKVTDPRLLDELTDIASRAGAEIMRVRAAAPATRQKADLTPVTDADEAAEALILESLSRLLPGIPIVSEEDIARGAAPTLEHTFVLVDPLDGTREFIAGRDEFTVNIALVEDGTPRIGVIGAPARGTIWRGAIGTGAQRLRLAPGEARSRAQAERIAARQLATPRVAVMSRSHLDPATRAFAARWPNLEAVSAGSSLKFALIAEGAADIYPRLSPTCEWDIAAGHAIAAAAGALVVTPGGEPLIYGRASEKFRVPAFIAWANPSARMS
jgi:3'(2'), 5'-bisphosphate nucleotidase